MAGAAPGSYFWVWSQPSTTRCSPWSRRLTLLEERGPVAKTFRPYDPHQVLLLPPSLDEWLPEGHLARFVSELVEEVLDLSAIRGAYTEERGYPPYDPRLMLKLRSTGTAPAALVAGHREALLGRRGLPLLVGRRGAGLPIDRPLPAPASEGARGAVPAGAAALPASGDGAT